MTNTDPGSPGSPHIHTCSNCFAEFEWIPFVLDGDDFCCSGCSEGGPCICTYNGAPHLTNATTAAGAAGSTDDSQTAPVADDEAASEEALPVASTSDGTPPEPPDQPPAPSLSPGDDEEVPTNGRLAIIMAAISEMPIPVQEIVRARLSNSGSDDQIGAPLGLDGDEVRALIEQGQAILDRTIGSSFQIRYIGTDEMPADDAPEPEFPAFDDVEDEPVDLLEPSISGQPVEGDQRDLSQLIASSFSSLADASTAANVEDPDARNVLSETLREVGNLLKLASDRLVSEEPSDLSLRDELADARGADEPVTLIIENQLNITDFFMAIQQHESVQWAKLQSQAPGRAEFRLVIGSMMGFVRDLMTMDGQLRPSRLQMAGNEITVALPGMPAEEGQVAAVPQPAVAQDSSNRATPGQRFEMSVDSFFGARHFIDSGSSAPHHHSYRVEATFVTSEPDHNGFVVGFANVREMVDSTVLAYSETLLNTEDPFTDIPPTTENLAKVFHQKVSLKLQELNVPSVGLDRIRVWESPTNSASYSSTGSSLSVNPGTGTESDAAAAS